MVPGEPRPRLAPAGRDRRPRGLGSRGGPPEDPDLEDAGAIQGYEAYPSIHSLEHDAAGYLWRVDDPDEKASALDRLASVEGVVEVADYVGDPLFVHLAYRSTSQARRRLARLEEIVPGPEPDRIARTTRPGSGSQLSNLDWRIVHALRGDAKRSPSEVAEEVGVSYRTVKRHVDRMTGEGVLCLAPKVDPGEFSGVLVFDLFCTVDADRREAVRRELRELFSDRILSARAPWALEPPYVDLVLHADTVAVTERIRQEAGEVDGVTSSRVAIPRRRFETDWREVQIQTMVELTEKPS